MFNGEKSQVVPVFMHHTVGDINHDWLWPHLTCPWKIFEDHLKWMRRCGIETITLQQLYDYKKSNLKIPARSVVLTFDDGYLDNWVYAYPLLKKYGYRATIYVNPEFIDPRKGVRNNLDDVWNENSSLDDLESNGFLSWDEMRVMESEGVIDIQSHSMSHTWYFCGENIVDFHHPGNKKHPWMFWNARPDRKSYYMNENQQDFVPYGTPIYAHGRSLGIKRYFEPEQLTEFLVEFVNRKGPGFFSSADWRDELFKQVELYRSLDNAGGRTETQNEWERRYTYELEESKRIIEKELNKKADFLCWPGGAYNDESIQICFRQGYKSYTVSAMKKMGNNSYPEDPTVFYRIGAPNIQYKGRMIYLGGIGFLLRYFSFRNSLVARVMQKCLRHIMKLMVDLNIVKDGAHIG